MARVISIPFGNVALKFSVIILISSTKRMVSAIDGSSDTNEPTISFVKEKHAQQLADMLNMNAEKNAYVAKKE